MNSTTLKVAESQHDVAVTHKYGAISPLGYVVGDIVTSVPRTWVVREGDRQCRVEAKTTLKGMHHIRY